MGLLRRKTLGAALLGLLAAVTAVLLYSTSVKTPPPVAESGAVAAPAPPPAPEPEPAPLASRSRGQRDWPFFFRAGDTLSRMKDGTMLGVVLRLEPQHRFADGSTGPAYVVQLTDQRESVFDADELERGARIESIRDVRIPPARPAAPTPNRPAPRATR
jgi:hypothetical protein